MKQILTTAFVLLCCLGMAQQAQTIPEKFRGNWLQTDGSNSFTVGLYAHQVAYATQVWALTGLQENENGITLQLKNKKATTTLRLQEAASNRILLQTPTGSILLGKTLTWNYQYTPPAQDIAFKTTPNGKATIRGLCVKKEKVVLRNNIATVFYINPFTGEQDNFFCETDASDGFEISIPVYTPVWAEVVFPNESKQNVFIVPGSEVLLVNNNNIDPGNAQNPDYNQLFQRYNYMGSLAAFNSGYLHYNSYKQTMAKIPDGLLKGVPKEEKYHTRQEYLLNLLRKGRTTLAAIYSPRRFDPLLAAYIQEDFTYTIGTTYLDGMRDTYQDGEMYNFTPTGNAFKQFSDTFFIQESSLSPSNPSYRAMVMDFYRKYSYQFHSSRSYRVENMMEEIEKRYKDGEYMLSTAPIARYIDIAKKMETRRYESEKELIKEYFNGDMEEAKRYAVIMRELRSQIFAESEDTAKYAIVKAALPTARSRQLADLQNLAGSSYENGYPINRYRIEKFRLYHPEMDSTAMQLFETLNTQYSLNMITGALGIQNDSNRFRSLINERDFQEMMKQYRGKYVVVVQFPHYYEKAYTEKALFQMKQMETRYRDSNVVFLKMIKARNRSDRDENIRKYMLSLKRADALYNACYMEDSVSVFYHWYLGWNGATFMQIYNTDGKMHVIDPNMREKYEAAIQLELSKVLAGKGAYYENFFPRMLTDRSYEVGGWIRTFQAPPYYSFVRKFKRDMREEDSVFVRFQFLPDSSYREYAEKRKKDSYLPNSIQLFTNVPLKYQFNIPKREISIFTANRRLYKKFRLVFIGPDSMCMELLEEHPEVLDPKGK